jgi:hypothetical protein
VPPAMSGALHLELPKVSICANVELRAVVRQTYHPCVGPTFAVTHPPQRSGRLDLTAGYIQPYIAASRSASLGPEPRGSSPHLTLNDMLICVALGLARGCLPQTDKVTWFSTARARAGFLLAPQWLLYGTAGAGFGETQATVLET